jgi:chemotaxis protein MotB
MTKKCKCPDVKKGLDGWIMTYGDMMSLLLTFFVLIVSFSSMQESKFHDAATSLREALGGMTTPPSVIQMQQPIIPQVSSPEAEDILYEVRQLEQSLLDTGLDKEVEIEVTEKGIAFRINAPFLFASGKADLKSQTAEVLRSLANFLAKLPYPIRIEGHTDNVPIHTSRFPSNWELSAARSVAVARFFQGAGVAPERLAALGYGEYRPRETNETAAGRAKNRRVEVFLKLQEEKTLGGGLPLEGEELNDGG